MTPFVLGISFGFHDASAAIVSSEGVIAFAAEERLSRQKHDSSFPRLAVDECLRQAGLSLNDMARVAYHERPEPAFTRVLTSALAGFPRSSREFSASMRAWLSNKLWVRTEIEKRIPSQKVSTIDLFPHHDCHAAQSFFTSGYDESAILTLDAVGEWTSTGIFHGRDSKLQSLKSVKFPHSLGLFYSAMTAYLGFVPMDGECSTMALAAFGKPTYTELFRRILKFTPEGFHVDQSYFQFVEFYQQPFTKKLTKILGHPRSQFEKLNFSSWGNVAISDDEQRFADIAASVQSIYEEAVLHLATLAKRLSGSTQLCLSGGGALNSVAVRKLADAKIFDDIYIPPDPGDGGAAAGAALLSLAKEFSIEPTSSWRPSIGSHVQSKELGFVKQVRTEHAGRYSKLGLKPIAFEIEEIDVNHNDILAREVAKLIVSGKIVGWCQGRFEAGPRALGSRSILIRPDNIDLAKRLSNNVKSRAAFRPYALSIIESDAERVLQNYNPKLRPYHWMQIVDTVNPQCVDQLHAGLHIDGTTRPQVVFQSEAPRYHLLLTEVQKWLGIGAVINTSFNESGYPIVNTAIEAMAIFLRSGMDALVVENKIYLKNTK
jgi:carbamoyltransferase